jgi:hypothetical protein
VRSDEARAQPERAGNTPHSNATSLLQPEKKRLNFQQAERLRLDRHAGGGEGRRYDRERRADGLLDCSLPPTRLHRASGKVLYRDVALLASRQASTHANAAAPDRIAPPHDFRR